MGWKNSRTDSSAITSTKYRLILLRKPNKLKLLTDFVSNMGMRYLTFRIVYAFQQKTGVLKRKFPNKIEVLENIPKQIEWSAFIDNIAPWKIPDAKNTEHISDLKQRVDNYKKGKFRYFSSFWLDSPLDEWHTNPENNFCYDINKHWSEINDFDRTAGDIKYVWEKARFSWVYDVIRLHHHYGVDGFDFIFDQIRSFIDQNPINMGAHYKCSQEISLRSINWTYTLWYYKDDPRFDDELYGKIVQHIFGQWKHVCGNIHFSRIAVRNNHAITESLFIYLGALWYPFFKGAAEWRKRGKKWFEKEIAYQIYQDGTYLQFSMNYHRVVIQLMNLAITSAHRSNDSFIKEVYHRAEKSCAFLYQCQELNSGYLPNYGANDGALFFPLSESDYRDYRPSLNALFQTLSGKSLYPKGMHGEESDWFNSIVMPVNVDKPEQSLGYMDYSIGGFYLFRTADLFVMIRCGSHKDRPSQADNLHVDVWYKGENVLFDGGTFRYNTTKEKQKYYFGTESHNTLMIGGEDQMYKGGRFIWFFWTQAVKAKAWEDETSLYFEGSVSAFLHVKSDIEHSRSLKIDKKTNSISIVDKVHNAKPAHPLRQLWHHEINPPFKLIGESNENIVLREAYHSPFYGVEKPCEITEVRSITDIVRSKIKFK